MKIARLALVIFGLGLALFVSALPYTGRGGGGVELLIAAAMVAVGAERGYKLLALTPLVFLLLRGQLNRSSDLELEACRGNLAQIAAGLQKEKARSGVYPKTLGESVAVPPCPAAGRETYRSSYSAQASVFTLYCDGRHHSRRFYDSPYLDANSPYWDGAEGAAKERKNR